MFHKHPIKFITVQCFMISVLTNNFKFKYVKNYESADGTSSFNHHFTIGHTDKSDEPHKLIDPRR